MRLYKKHHKIRHTIDMIAFITMAAAASGLDAPDIRGNIITIICCAAWFVYSILTENIQEVWYDAD